ncbi:MAG: AAA family ATPase [Egibacteraceae bacterium]
MSGSDFVELYAGVGASRVRELFKQAREHAPAIVFIDELDSVGRRRTTGTASGASMRDEQEQALNQILAEMDGFSPTEGIIVLGATNRPDTLDPALLRPGRFDRTIGLERADEAGRLAILEVHARGKPLDPDADLAAVARRAIGLTGADLASVANEAALLAARVGRSVIGQGELDTALTRILEAPERQRRLSLRERGIGRRSVGGADRVTFADVAGVDDARAELVEISDFLAHPERFTELGARVPRGVLLTGPPGCGKNLLARAVAGEANAAFFSASAPEFVEVFVGQGATRVRDLFADAAAAAPAILFIDEIDAVGARRGADIGSSTEREQNLNQILVALDGFEERAAVIVIAATNRPDILDPALIRPGRFDRQVTVTLPDRAGRREILAIHAAGKSVAPDVDLDTVAGVTPGFSGADLANVLNEAALLAARRNETAVTRAGLDEAIERTMLGVSSRRTVLTGAERRAVAHHEAGHAVVGRWLPSGRVPHKLSLVGGGKALGFTWHADGGERTVHSRSGLIDQMATLLGGRVAEQLALGEPGTAAADDLTRATVIAERMVTELGMGNGLNPRSYATGRAPSALSAQRIDAEVDALLAEAREQACTVLAGARDALDRVAEALLAHETLTAEQFEALVAAPDPAGPGRAG